MSMFVAPLLDGGRWPVNGTETTILKAVRRVFTFPEELPDVGGLVAGIHDSEILTAGELLCAIVAQIARDDGV